MVLQSSKNALPDFSVLRAVALRNHDHYRRGKRKPLIVYTFSNQSCVELISR